MASRGKIVLVLLALLIILITFFLRCKQLFSEKVQRIKQHHLISTTASPELSKETVDFFLMFVRLYTE